MVATLSGMSGKSGKTKKKDKSPEKSGENGGFQKNFLPFPDKFPEFYLFFCFS